MEVEIVELGGTNATIKKLKKELKHQKKENKDLKQRLEKFVEKQMQQSPPFSKDDDFEQPPRKKQKTATGAQPVKNKKGCKWCGSRAHRSNYTKCKKMPEERRKELQEINKRNAEARKKAAENLEAAEKIIIDE